MKIKKHKSIPRVYLVSDQNIHTFQRRVNTILDEVEKHGSLLEEIKYEPLQHGQYNTQTYTAMIVYKEKIND